MRKRKTGRSRAGSLVITQVKGRRQYSLFERAEIERITWTRHARIQERIRRRILWLGISAMRASVKVPAE